MKKTSEHGQEDHHSKYENGPAFREHPPHFFCKSAQPWLPRLVRTAGGRVRSIDEDHLA